MEENKNKIKNSGSFDVQDLRRIYLRPAFLICVTILAVSVLGMETLTKKLGIVFSKEPLALKKPLDQLQGAVPDQIGPYKVVSREILGEDMIKALGTGDYILWMLEDISVPEDSDVRRCSLFITYYGLADKAVTHVPDECYIGGGFDRTGEENVTLNVQIGDSSEKARSFNTKYIKFGTSDNSQLVESEDFAVLYFFYVNGSYTGSRTSTRLQLSKNIFGKYSYYSKIEWSFSGTRMGSLVRPNKAQTIEASEKLLGTILPILEQKHWPDEADPSEEYLDDQS
jgi:hypothetical protein